MKLTVFWDVMNRTLTNVSKGSVASVFIIFLQRKHGESSYVWIFRKFLLEFKGPLSRKYNLRAYCRDNSNTSRTSVISQTFSGCKQGSCKFLSVAVGVPQYMS